jgi:hypothetical protein
VAHVEKDDLMAAYRAAVDERKRYTHIKTQRHTSTQTQRYTCRTTTTTTTITWAGGPGWLTCSVSCCVFCL